MKQCALLFHDESCNPGDDCFIVGLLKVYDRSKLMEAIQSARERWHFSNELHFTKMSNLRFKVYLEVFNQVAPQVENTFHFSCICVKRERIDVDKYFSGQKHLAYNFFTKLLLQHRCRNVVDAELITDEKTRKIEDNFVEYIEWEINQSSSDKLPIRKVTVMSSKEDDLLQLTDLLTGATGATLNKMAAGRKKDAANHALQLGLLKDRWIWAPRK